MWLILLSYFLASMTLTTVRNQKNLGNYYTPWFPFVSTLKSQTDDEPKSLNSARFDKSARQCSNKNWIELIYSIFLHKIFSNKDSNEIIPCDSTNLNSSNVNSCELKKSPLISNIYFVIETSQMCKLKNSLTFPIFIWTFKFHKANFRQIGSR